MKTYEELENESRQADEELLNQYRKELSDLENGVGLSSQMSKKEIEYAKKNLKEAINSFKGYLF